MSLLENESFKRILTRFKRLLLILLLLPILLAGLGYFIEMNQKTTSTATAEIMLGNVDFQIDKIKYEFTDVGTVQQLLKNEKFLNELKNYYNLSYDSEDLAGKTNTVHSAGKVIEITYSANSREESENVLQELVVAFERLSKESYEDQSELLEDLIKDMESANGNESVKDLYDMKEKLEGLRPLKIHKDVSVEEGNNNPMRRAILGFLIGTMFSISILLAPEVFRK
jgi:teichuronic acid biosynthesis protein TuaF